MAIVEPLGHLAHTGGLTRPLQTGHQHNGRRLAGKIQARCGRRLIAGHEAHQLPMHHAHQGLPGSEASHHLLAYGLFAHLGHKLLNHRQGHVGIEQGQPNLAQHLLGVGLGNPSLPLHGLHHL